eukprot:4013262-Amphidinium_carterae.1
MWLVALEAWWVSGTSNCEVHLVPARSTLDDTSVSHTSSSKIVKEKGAERSSCKRSQCGKVNPTGSCSKPPPPPPPGRSSPKMDLARSDARGNS